MPQASSALCIFVGAVLLGGCIVSFDGYELSADASTGGSVSGGSGGVGAVGGGVTGGGTGSSGGVSGSGNAGGGTGGGTGGAPGGNGGTAGGGGSLGGTGGSAPTCPTEGGPMILVPKPTGGGSYCVDATEVTQQRYQAFLGAGPDPSQQIAGCVGQSFTPIGTCNGWDPQNYVSRPAVCVDWCDAYGFCKFVGKHLCGQLVAGGGSVNPGSANDETMDEWYNACSSGGTQLYPYANLYDGGKCNGLNAPTTGPTDVLFFAQCIGGFPDILGMSGNVREWVDSCTGTQCMQRGGSWEDGAAGAPSSFNLACTSNGMGQKTAVSDRIGFRCCADAN